jgi:broad specificity phosphatase PhoE
MTMPRNLVFIRHGQSEANVRQQASKAGEDVPYTDEYMTIPDRSWRLTARGVQQAITAGAWLNEQFPAFDRHIVSPYTRTRETAGHLQLTGAQWEENRAVRERGWGEIDSISRAMFAEKYPENYRLYKKDPIYWAPPAGESIAVMSENRVRNLLNTLHRENSEDDVAVQTHGEYMWGARLTLERLSDEEYMELDEDPSQRMHNCMVLRYTRVDPVTQKLAPRLSWLQRAWPVEEDGVWTMKVTPWMYFERTRYTSADLLSKAEVLPRVLEVQAPHALELEA